jgi:uncharacterized protein with NRDE domain
MCLIAWNWQPQGDTPLMLIGNRDEFYARPALPLHWWDVGTVLAGRDIQGGGTWLGVSRSGRLAALTNFRSSNAVRDHTPSRGELVANFLQTDQTTTAFLNDLTVQSHRYNPFNLLVFDGVTLMGFQSRDAKVVPMLPGVGAVSNADFHTPWPKLDRLSKALKASTAQNASDNSTLIGLLQDRCVAPDEALPQTGIPIEFERALSAVFVSTPEYGTRASSVIRIRRNWVEFFEQTHIAHATTDSECQVFELTASSIGV